MIYFSPIYFRIQNQSLTGFSFYLSISNDAIQIVTDKLITDFESSEAETDKQNPYHGMLTLTIQGKGADSHALTTPRGPGRPPLNDISIDDLAETDDPVSRVKVYFFSQCKIHNFLKM